MKTRTLVLILILVLTVLIITSGCATTPKGLRRSAESGDYAEVKRLIEHGINVNARTLHGETALMFASKMGHTEVVRLLIEEGANVNAKTKSGITMTHTALMYASEGGHTEIAKLLIEAGADVNAVCVAGGHTSTSSVPGWGPRHYAITKTSTALIAASSGWHTEIVKLLIEAGADVNTRNSRGYTALMWALEKGYTGIVMLLREVGAKE